MTRTNDTDFWYTKAARLRSAIEIAHGQQLPCCLEGEPLYCGQSNKDHALSFMAMLTAYGLHATYHHVADIETMKEWAEVVRESIKGFEAGEVCDTRHPTSPTMLALELADYTTTDDAREDTARLLARLSQRTAELEDRDRTIAGQAAELAELRQHLGMTRDMVAGASMLAHQWGHQANKLRAVVDSVDGWKVGVPGGGVLMHDCGPHTAVIDIPDGQALAETLNRVTGHRHEPMCDAAGNHLNDEDAADVDKSSDEPVGAKAA